MTFSKGRMSKGSVCSNILKTYFEHRKQLHDNSIHTAWKLTPAKQPIRRFSRPDFNPDV